MQRPKLGRNPNLCVYVAMNMSAKESVKDMATFQGLYSL